MSQKTKDLLDKYNILKVENTKKMKQLEETREKSSQLYEMLEEHCKFFLSIGENVTTQANTEIPEFPLLSELKEFKVFSIVKDHQ